MLHSAYKVLHSKHLKALPYRTVKHDQIQHVSFTHKWYFKNVDAKKKKKKVEAY